MTVIPEITNRVANSGIITLDLDDYYFDGPRISIDLKDWLWEGLILKEKDFREKVAAHDWTQYEGAAVAVYCSEPDTLIPAWAWMLIASRLAGAAHAVVLGDGKKLEEELARQALEAVKAEDYAGKRVVLKGCSKHSLPPSAYVILTERLTPVVQSLMFGEACSAVPVYKKARATSSL